jgi:MFS transporter, SP family, sugar:H+ symporter
VIPTTFPTLKDSGLGLVYGIYAGLPLCPSFFVYRFVSETNGQELEEMTGEVGAVAHH